MPTMTRAEYIAAKGAECPCCGTHETEGGDRNFESGLVTLEVWCKICDAEWTETYTLSNFTLTTNGNPQ